MSGFDQRTTTLDLNGPVLSWDSLPTAVTSCGVGSFIGIDTASFTIATSTAVSIATLSGNVEKPIAIK